MGAPKQKWTSEEEIALKAGIAKYGAGKWKVILKDAEFRAVLSSRSNVDLKDKWRNMCVTAYGCGSREKGRLALKKSQQISKSNDGSLALNTVQKSPDEAVFDIKPLATSSGTPQVSGQLTRSLPSVSRLENLILEAIVNLKEPNGSNKTDIVKFIEDQYDVSLDLKRALSKNLKALTASGNLIKVNRKYRIAPSAVLSKGGLSSGQLRLDENRRGFSKVDKEDFRPPKVSQFDAELARMRNMTAEEAAAAAAQAVAEAEAAMAEAEAAVMEAEAAEADAEAAQAFAEAAMQTLRGRLKVQG